MSNILVNSTAEIEEIKGLLEKSLPSYRQAYSDRTSWLMACISELAYVKFNPLFKNQTKDYFIKKISELIDGNKIKYLNQLIEIVGYDPEKEMDKLKENVELLNMEIKVTCPPKVGPCCKLVLKKKERKTKHGTETLYPRANHKNTS